MVLDMASDPIEVSYVPTSEDLIAQQAYMIASADTLRSRKLLRQRLLVSAIVMPPFGALALIGGAMVYVAIKRGYSPSPAMVTGLAVFGVVWAAQIVRALTARPDRGKPGKQLQQVIKRALGKIEGRACHYRFDEDGVTNEADGVVMFFPWSAIESARFAGGYWHLGAFNGVYMSVAEREVSDPDALHKLIAVRGPETG